MHTEIVYIFCRLSGIFSQPLLMPVCVSLIRIHVIVMFAVSRSELLFASTNKF